MSKISFEHKFEYLQTVYHKADRADREGKPGLIVDLSYGGKSGVIWYTVALGFNDEIVVREDELTTDRPVI